MPLFFPISHNKQVAEDYGLRTYVNKESQMEEMKFSIRIPSSFTLIKKMDEPPVPEMPVADLAYFKSTGGDLEVIVQCTHIQYEVSLEHFYHYTAELSGEQEVEKRLINQNEDKPDLLAQRTFPDGQTWVTRRTGYKVWNGAGAFVITVNAATNINDYVKYAELLYAITSSLQPVKQPEWTLAERLAMVSRRFPVDFATYIPISWKEYHHHSDTVDEMNLVYTRTLRKSISGMMSMCCIAEYKVGGTEAVLKKCHKGYLEQGADLSNLRLMKTDDLQIFNNVMKGTVDFPQEHGDQKKKNNITFYLAKKGNNWIYLEMFGPAKDTDYEAWSLNDRAFEIMKERIVAV